MQLKHFKTAYAGKIFIIDLSPHPTLLSFTDVEDMKNYVFSSADLKQQLYHRFSERPGGMNFIEDLSNQDIDEIEKMLYLHADRQMLAHIIAGQGHSIIIDVDLITPAEWLDLFNPENGSDRDKQLTFDILNQLLK